MDRLSRRRAPFLSIAVVSFALVAGLATPGTLTTWAVPEGPKARTAPAEPEPVPAVGEYLAGRFAQHQDDWAAAARFMAGALARDPDDLNLLRRTFLLKLGEGHIDEAVPLAERLLPAHADAPIPVVLLIANDLVAGNLASGSHHLADLTNDGLSKYLKPMVAAWLRVAEGKPAEGLAELAPLEASPGLAVMHALHAAKISELAGDSDGAAHWYEIALNGGGNTLRVVRAVGGFYRRAGKIELARSLYQDFVEHNPDGVILDSALDALDTPPTPLAITAREGLAEALFDIASALHQEGSEEVSLVYGRIALYLSPTSPLPQLMIADIMSARGHHEAAIALYREVEADPVLAWTARLRNVDSLARLDRLDEAAADLEKMAAERPERADSLIRLGDLLRGAKRNQAAIDAYDRAIARLPKLDERYWPVLYGRAVVYNGAGNWPRAEADLAKAIEISPDQPILLNYLGYSWADQGNHLDKARQMIERAVELRPKDGYIIDSLGWVLFRMNDLAGAVGQLERAIELKPLDPTINDHLGDAYWAIGRHQEAFFQWRRALQYADEDDLKQAIEKKLEERGKLDRRAGMIPGVYD
ncbi:MAG: tetratricopeptide repeat protein [Azospirillum sp.]|nr:tetratricopeptide repeat protein [Azospirillum sp.]